MLGLTLILTMFSVTPYYYNVNSVTTIKGKVIDVTTSNFGRRNMSYAVIEVLSHSAGTVRVYLGPTWYVGETDLKGQEVSVTGSLFTDDSTHYIVASEVTVEGSGRVLRFRDKNGFPLWSGTGMRRFQGNGYRRGGRFRP